MEVEAAPKEESKDLVMESQEEEFVGLPDDATETLYVKNLNESVKVDVMKKTLNHLFSLYGRVLDVTAHENVRMRGQAFIAFDAKEPAAKAIKEVTGFPLYGKPMQLAFARARSDANVRTLEGESAVEAHKRARMESKKQKRTEWRKRLMAMKAGEGEGPGAGITTSENKRQEAQMPDEYLPPNKLLFIHNVPADVSREQIDALFRTYEGLLDVRLVPGRGVAFVEFGDAMQSSVARDALNGHIFSSASEKLRITFAK